MPELVAAWLMCVRPQTQALIGKGPNLLLASSNGLLDLAKCVLCVLCAVCVGCCVVASDRACRCGALALWTLDAAFVAALPPAVLQLVTWRGTQWALPIAQETNVLFVNRALFPGVVPADLASFVALLTNCSARMVYQCVPRSSLSCVRACSHVHAGANLLMLAASSLVQRCSPIAATCAGTTCRCVRLCLCVCVCLCFAL